LTTEEFELAAQISGMVEAEEDSSIIDLLVNSGLATSKSDASRLIKAKGVTINGDTVTDPMLKEVTFFHGRFLILKKGKKSVRIVRRKEACMIG
jgi:tyrosyl-tRNA synthetase